MLQVEAHSDVTMEKEMVPLWMQEKYYAAL